ncbi:enolase-phosphatase E1-like isoform X2 [Linepithema humile]|uniref:enolase-phosphatase E1-like isoform X2 n=1 Tax=Linepithema humile TaxID=83485 RepID=UPI00062329F2|nr:PREDICTED: kinesin-related protein 4-like isoform X2 [Linepithema humile]
MSENSERSPDDTETETKAVEDLPNNSSKSEVKLMMNRTDATLLEDEEMPTYISVSSTSRRDDSDVVNVKQQDNEPQDVEEDHCPSPYNSDDQAPSSVYVLSSEEETDHHAFNDEDDEDEYADSEEMENLELNKFHRERRQMNHLMDEEDDDEDDEDEEEDEEGFRQMQNDDDDDDIDSNYERNWNDRKSDDFLLTKRLKNQDKEKSLSLQDLNTYRNHDFVGYSKRQHLQNTKQNYLNIPQNAVTYSMIHRKPSFPTKYHVESKVKLYIKEIREQSRRSMERQTKQHQEDAIHNKNNTDHENNDTRKMESTMPNKRIKSYAERTIKELEIAEVCDRNKVAYNISSVMLNGQDNRNGLESVQEECIQNEVQINIPFEQTQNETDPLITDDKTQKQNGTVEVKQLKFNFPERETPRFIDAMQPSLIQNGHQEVPTVYNLHNVNYEEYVHSSSSQKTDLNKNARVIQQEQTQHEIYNNAEPIDIDNDTTCALRIENIKSIRAIADEAKNNEQATFDKINEGLSKPSDALEIITLKDQLNQKTVQYNDLHNAYQKQLAENLKIKQEMDELRESLAKYKKESKPLEQKVASIQTDITDSTHKHNQTEPTHVKQSNNKISNSSVALTLSSIDQWSDNLSISMKPPEAAKALHSDDSMMLTDATPRKTARPLSRTFITSSRILQTLASITQGKAKPESPLVQNSKKRLNESTAMDLQNDDDSYQNRSSNFKKRKIADIPGVSNIQSYKAFETTGESSSKLNETTNEEYHFKYSYDSINERVQSQEGLSNTNTSHLGAATSTAESKTESADPEDNVKCFVYHENENSKNRSFLIQAEEPKEEDNEKGRLRECGPFLLGNLEVRMSEINGTVNIWGKEISQESTAETENEIETSTKVKDKKYHCWQKTPQTRYNGSNLVCSTSKKSKYSPKFELSPAAFNFSHSSSFNTAKPSCSTDKAHADNVYNASTCVSSCENCDSSKNHEEWTSKEKLSSKERSSFSRNLEPNKHLHESNPTMEDGEFTCRCHTACHHSLHDQGENCQESPKCYNTLRKSCTCKPLTMNTDRECSDSCNHLSPNVHEDEPLIGLKQNSETPETKRRRLIGKRVRGVLMDFIRGCGDCYNSNASTSNKGCTHKKESNLMNCSPQIKITPCASPEQAAGRCCHAYAKRIESQLEEFRVEMEKVRTRSDAILNMLNMLQSVDTN